MKNLIFEIGAASLESSTISMNTTFSDLDISFFIVSFGSWQEFIIETQKKSLLITTWISFLKYYHTSIYFCTVVDFAIFV